LLSRFYKAFDGRGFAGSVDLGSVDF